MSTGLQEICEPVFRLRVRSQSRFVPWENVVIASFATCGVMIAKEPIHPTTCFGLPLVSVGQDHFQRGHQRL